MKRITVRLTGAPASIAGTRCASLEVEDGSTYLDVIGQLGQSFPNLIGVIIASDGKTMLSSNLFLVNGQDYIMPGMWDRSPQDGDTLLLISPITGG
jgi:molybdopterin converting factor small subunit